MARIWSRAFASGVMSEYLCALNASALVCLVKTLELVVVNRFRAHFDRVMIPLLKCVGLGLVDWYLIVCRP